MPLRIGINALYLIPGGVGGTEIYLRSLLAGLAEIDQTNEYLIYANRETGLDLAPASPRFRLIRCGVVARIRPFRIAFEQSVMPWMLARDNISVVLNPGYTAPLLTRCPSVTVFHDMQHKKHPEFFRSIDLPFWNLLLPLAAARSRRLIAVSESTRRDLAFYLPCSIGKTSVIPHGVDREFFRIGERRGRSAAEPYVLTVSTLHPHKNLERLIEAFHRFRGDHPEYRLIIVGLRGFAAGRIEARIDELRLSDSVVVTGWIPRRDLHALFERASAFIAPSLFEGFGLTVLEALAAGIPTACSAIEVFDSLAGNVAARFDPLSVPAIAGAIKRIVTSTELRTRAAITGPERARAFDWRRTAELTLRELTQAGQARPPNAP